MMERKRWVLRRGDPEREKAISQALGVSPLLGRLLVVRGVATAAEARAFLAPIDGPIYPAEYLDGVPAAVDRILVGAERKEKVLLHGDYDVDGISAVALLLPVLAQLGLQVHPYLPHRIDDGYGVSLRAVEAAAQAGIRLLITVDCGITAHAELDRARELGMETIVTDHHTPEDTLPVAVAAVDPKLPGCRYPNPYLVGVGVAYKLAVALSSRAGLPPLPPSVEELVALGTLADAATILDENRTLVACGLAALRNTERPGLVSLFEAARIVPDGIQSDAVTFAVVPRLNALGRVGDPDDALALLVTDSWERGRRLALAAEDANRERRRIQAATIREIEKQLALEPEMAERGALVLWGPEWHRGVLGIVAAKLWDRFQLPAFVISVDTAGNSFGSARSDGSMEVTRALEACGDLLTSRGGHRQAGGFRLPASRLPEFRERIWAYAEASPRPPEVEPEIAIDCEIRLAELNDRLLEELSLLEPHGRGNPQPALLARDIRTKSEIQMFGDDHLRLACYQGKQCFQGVAFRQADHVHQTDLSRIDIVFEPQWNTWRDQRTIELRIIDLRPHASAPVYMNGPPVRGHDEPPPAEWLVDLRNEDERVHLAVNSRELVLVLTNPDTPRGALDEWLRKTWKRNNPVWLDSAAIVGRFRPNEHTTFVVHYDDVEPLWDRNILPDHIILWDFPPREACLPLVGALRRDGRADCRVYVAFTLERFEWQRHVLEREHPDRDLLSRLYLAIRRIEHPSPIPLELVRERVIAARLPAECLEVALPVFQELGFLSVDQSSAELSLDPTPRRRSLDESAAYRDAMQWRREREALARFLLTAPLSEIERRLVGSS